ncbi:MAG: CaiB/BaiF CoA transferase family protein [Sandaracinaceae bacterium]
MTDPPTSTVPYRGLKVLELAENLPGPYAGFLLASWGADVVKIEPPRGDAARGMRPFFDMLNRGKRSVVLDLRDPARAAARDALLRWADVVIEGYRPGVAARLGVDGERARRLNPRVVHCAISAFGQSGPRRRQPGHDLNLQALTGVCALEGGPRGTDGGFAMLPVADLSSSLIAVAAVGAALAARGEDGKGRCLDVAMADGALSWANLWGVGANPAPRARALLSQRGGPVLTALGGPLLRTLARLRIYALPHYGVYRCGDGRYLALGIVDEGHFWRALVEALGLPRVLGTLDQTARTVSGPLLSRLVARRLRQRPRDAWLERLEARDVPATPVLRPEEAVRDPQVQARGMADERGWVRAPLPQALHLGGLAPGLGADTEQVLAELGLDPHLGVAV